MTSDTNHLSGLTRLLAQSRNRTLDEQASIDSLAVRLYSGTTYALWCAAKGSTSAVSKGLVLDAGSGRGGWRSVIERSAKRETVDLFPKPGEDVTWVADIQAMPQVPADRYDAAICHQVLEHVPRPADAIAELLRVLRPGGMIVLSVPHLSRRHELPYDFHRFTPEGVEYLLRASGFEDICIVPYGGILSFLHHQFATVLLGVAASWRPLLRLCSTLNAPLAWLTAKVDPIIDRHGLLCVGVVAFARKPEVDANAR